MASLQHSLLSVYLKYLQGKQARSKNPLALRRKLINEVADKFRIPKKTNIVRLSANGIPCEKVSPSFRTGDQVIMYCHGGAYVAGSLKSHRHLVAAITEASNSMTYAVDYRLAPEHPFPSAIDDAYNAYQWIIKNQNGKPVILMGDSAGGGLVVALVQKLLEENTAKPAACVLIAPWVDLTSNSPTISSVGKKDVILSEDMLESSARMYAHDNVLDHPYVSPLFGNLSGFPEVLIHIGTRDMLLGDSRQLADKLLATGTPVTLKEWKGLIHVWHFFTDYLPEAKKAIREIGEFCRSIPQA